MSKRIDKKLHTRYLTVLNYYKTVEEIKYLEKIKDSLKESILQDHPTGTKQIILLGKDVGQPDNFVVKLTQVTESRISTDLAKQLLPKDVLDSIKKESSYNRLSVDKVDDVK